MSEEEGREERRQHIARHQVRAFIERLEKDYNVSIKDIQDAIERNKKISRWGEWAARTIVGSVSIALVLATYEGIRHFLKFKGHSD